MRLPQALLLTLAWSGLALAQPRAVLEPERFDFGRVPATAQVSHRFTLANGGDAPLEIRRVVPSCGCTTVLVGRTTLAPGERTELEVTFTAAGFQGPVRKGVEVLTNDPAQPRTSLEVQAEVQAEILLASDQVAMLDLAPGDRRRRTLTLESGTGQPIVVTDVDLSPAPWLGVATREAGQFLYVDLDLLARRLPADRQAGSDRITLHLANPRPTQVILQVNWAKLPTITARPARVAWAEPAGRDLAATVTVRDRNRQPFRILAIRTSHGFLAAENLTPGPAPTHRLRVVLAGSAPAGTYDGKVTLELDVPGQQLLDIRVAAALR